MKPTFTKFLSLALLGGFLSYAAPSQAQVGTLIGAGAALLKNKKDKKKKGEAGEQDSKDNKKTSKKTQIERLDEFLATVNFDPATPVLNEDWSKGEAIKDAEKMSGDYYIWFPLTNRLEKVWLRWNNYTYNSDSKTFPGMLLVASVWTKDSGDNSILAIDFQARDNYMFSQERKIFAGDDKELNTDIMQYIMLKDGLFVGNVPIQLAKPNDVPSWKMIYQKYDSDENKPNFEEGQVDMFFEKERHSLFFLAKDKKQFEGLTWEKVFNDIKTQYDPYEHAIRQRQYAGILMARQPHSTSNDLYKDKASYRAAKAGMQSHFDATSKSKVLFGYADDRGWQTIKNKSTGAITHQVGYYWMVIERPEEYMKQKLVPKYELMGAIMIRNYNGSGYDKPYYKDFTTNQKTLSKADIDAIKAVAVE
ncbi:hypothetical protein [Hugenholtzia roseola]|uniref:hypothetical protein n=1 Tax=Hugenholtzia roseola TaxID=1002 RepID=UPI000429B4E2|nr:hypothetical protein [Hugenholtzia roseola]